MGKIIIVTSFLVISSFSSYGQWYVRDYNVYDISLLSKEQLEESLKGTKKDLLYSGVFAGIGGLTILGGTVTLNNGVDEDASFIEQLLGSKFMGKTYIVAGAGMVVGGIITGIIYLGRFGKIRSTINNNYPSAGSLNVSPLVILNSYTKSYCPGFTVTYNF